MEYHPPCPPASVTIRNFTRHSPPPREGLPHDEPNPWLAFHSRDLDRFPNGNLAHLILMQLSWDDERTLRAYTYRAPNLLVYRSRLQIVYHAIGAIATIAWWNKLPHCIIFPRVSLNKMKILTELVSAHGAQLYRATTSEVSPSWVIFRGREQLATFESVQEAVDRATAVTNHFD